MSLTPCVSVIIPNWNGKHFLDGCLRSLSEQSFSDFEVVVVDNGSIDSSAGYISENYPYVKLIALPKNTGFSFAVNRGIESAQGKFIALLNNDTVVDPKWLAELVQAFQRNPDAGSLACKMLAYHDRNILDGAGDGYRRGGLPGRIGHREKDQGQFNRERDVLGACAGAALYRRELFDEIGMFDEDFFAYLEDVDLNLRAQIAGFKCRYIPSAIVYHLGCGTTGSGWSAFVVKLSAQNNFNTLIKNIPASMLIKFFPQIVYWQAFYLAAAVRQGGQFIPWLAGCWGAVKLFPKMLVKRNQILRNRCVSLEYLEKVITDSERELNDSRRRLYRANIF